MSNKIKLFKQKPKYTYEVGSMGDVCLYRFDFYINERNIGKGKVDDTYLRISELNEQWGVIIPGNAHVFGYLLTAAKQDNLNQLLNYARLLYAVSMLVTTDQGLTNDLWRMVDKWSKRTFAKGAKNAKSVSEAEEMGAQAFMESVVERSQMSAKEAKQASDEDKALLREMLAEKGEGE